MGAKHFDSRVYEMPAEKIIDVVKSQVYASELNLSLKSENPTETGVWFRFHHGVTFSHGAKKLLLPLLLYPEIPQRWTFCPSAVCRRRWWISAKISVM